MASETIQPRVRRALAQRLGFRCAFLTTVGLAEDRSMPFEVKKSWTIALESLSGLRSELELSKPVPEAFSAKLQRKLASTVPPRPVVTVEIGAAYAHLERLCQDGLIVTEVLNFHDSHSLMVSLFPPFVCNSKLIQLEYCFSFPEAKATAFSLHPHSAPALSVWWDDNSRYAVHPKYSGQ